MICFPRVSFRKPIPTNEHSIGVCLAHNTSFLDGNKPTLFMDLPLRSAMEPFCFDLIAHVNMGIKRFSLGWPVGMVIQREFECNNVC